MCFEDILSGKRPCGQISVQVQDNNESNILNLNSRGWEYILKNRFDWYFILLLVARNLYNV